MEEMKPTSDPPRPDIGTRGGARTVPPDHPYLSSDAGLIRRLSPIDELPASYQRDIAQHGDFLILAAGEQLVVDEAEADFDHYLLAGTVGIEARGRPRLRMSSTEDAATAAIDPGTRPFRVHALGEDGAQLFRVARQVIERQFALSAQGRPAGELDVTELDGQHQSDDWVSRTLRNGVLAALPPERILQVLMRAGEMPVSAGQVIIDQGAPGDFYYLIKEGHARVARRIDRAGLVHLAEFGPGDGFGEEALVADNARNASVTMTTDGVLLKLDRADFRELVRDPLLTPLSRPQAEERIAHGALWLDVRYPGDFARWHLDDAVNLPLPLVRLQYHRLDANARYVTYGTDVSDSAVAALLLRLRGLDASHLDEAVIAPAAFGELTPDAAIARNQEENMSDHAPPSMFDDMRTAASTPESPEHYADTYTGQSLAQLVEEIHSSGIAPATTIPADAPAPSDDPPRIDLDGTVFRVDSLHDDDEVDEPTAPPDATLAAAPAHDAIGQLMAEFEQRLRGEVEAARRAERARHEQRFAERVALMRSRAEEVVREKLTQARARDRERLAQRERELDDFHARLAGLANRVTHQKARIQEARNALAEKLAAVESLHRELSTLGQSMTRQLDELDSLTTAEPVPAANAAQTELDTDPPGHGS